jgi:hypothetical protein
MLEPFQLLRNNIALFSICFQMDLPQMSGLRPDRSPGRRPRANLRKWRLGPAPNVCTALGNGFHRDQQRAIEVPADSEDVEEQVVDRIGNRQHKVRRGAPYGHTGTASTACRDRGPDSGWTAGAVAA